MMLRSAVVGLLGISLVVGCESADGGGGVGTQQADTGLPTDNPQGDTGSAPVTDAGGIDTHQSPSDTNTEPECTFNIDPVVEDACAGDQICILDHEFGQPGHCEGAYGRVYTVAVGYTRVPERDSAGECWDVGCGAPDLFVRISLDGQVVVETTPAQDVFEVDSFSERGSAIISANSQLEVALYDEDLSSDDLITSCELNPIAANYLRSRVLSCGQSGGPQFFFFLILQ